MSKSARGSVVLPEDYEPSQHDVLCGNIREYFFHEGNKQFRALVDRNVESYVGALTRQEKANVAQVIIGDVRTRSPGGGFITKKEITLDSGRSIRWCRLSESEAKDKVGHALRKASKLFEQEHPEDTARIRQESADRVARARESKEDGEESNDARDKRASSKRKRNTDEESSDDRKRPAQESRSRSSAASASLSPGPTSAAPTESTQMSTGTRHFASVDVSTNVSASMDPGVRSSSRSGLNVSTSELAAATLQATMRQGTAGDISQSNQNLGLSQTLASLTRQIDSTAASASALAQDPQRLDQEQIPESIRSSMPRAQAQTGLNAAAISSLLSQRGLSENANRLYLSNNPFESSSLSLQAAPNATSAASSETSRMAQLQQVALIEDISRISNASTIQQRERNRHEIIERRLAQIVQTQRHLQMLETQLSAILDRASSSLQLQSTNLSNQINLARSDLQNSQLQPSLLSPSALVALRENQLSANLLASLTPNTTNILNANAVQSTIQGRFSSFLPPIQDSNDSLLQGAVQASHRPAPEFKEESNEDESKDDFRTSQPSLVSGAPRRGVQADSSSDDSE